MSGKKQLKLIICVLLILCAAISFYKIKRGTYITRYFSDREVITRITLEKTRETSDGIESLGLVELSDKQQSELLQKIEQSWFCLFTSNTWEVESPIRYIIRAYKIHNEKDIPFIEIKVYNGKLFVFDYVPATTPAVHKKFKAIGEDWAEKLEMQASIDGSVAFR
ncbi:MAG: hypothetical protein IKM51_02950 [Oscillospiraceae bacterium]|nr:hypothetical protein [Oscillospiraceae bacterium]